MPMKIENLGISIASSCLAGTLLFGAGALRVNANTAEGLADSQPLLSQANTSQAEAKRLLHDAESLQTRGQHREAIALLQQAQPSYAASGDRAGEAAVLIALGLSYEALSDYARMGMAYKQALEIARQIEQPVLEAKALNGVGDIAYYAAEFDRARARYQEALVLCQQSGDRQCEATSLRNLGTAYRTEGDLERAAQLYARALPMFQATGDRQREANTLEGFGAIALGRGEPERAREYLNQALAILTDLGDRNAEASILNYIGVTYASTGQLTAALEFYERALVLHQETGNRIGEAATLNGLGTLYANLGQTEAALDYLERSLPILREIGNRSGEAATLSGIGQIYADLGDVERSLEFHQQALPIFQAARNPAGVAVTHNNIGALQAQTGQLDRATEQYANALEIYRGLGDRRGIATSQSNLGSIAAQRGQTERALELYTQALAGFQAVGDPAGEAATLNSIGTLYLDIGQTDIARDYYTRVQTLREGLGDLRGAASTLASIGRLDANAGNLTEALDQYARALPVQQELGDRRGAATTLNYLGAAHAAQGRPTAARDAYAEALAIQQDLGDLRGIAASSTNLGQTHAALGQPDLARQNYAEALTLTQQIGDRRGEASVRFNLARLERDWGDLAAALEQIRAAIDTLEDIRSAIGTPEQRTAFFATVQGYYQLQIEILMQLHRQDPSQNFHHQALETAERARARSLIDLLREANLDIRQGVTPELLAREDRLRRQLDRLEEQRLQGLNTGVEPERIRAIERELSNYLGQYQQVQNRIRRESPAYAALTQAPDIPLTASKIQGLLDADTLLLEYSLGQERSYLWVVGADGITSYELPGREEITALARTYRRLLTEPNLSTPNRRARYDRVASETARMLFGDAAERFGRKRLVVVSDGALQYLPFGAIPAPGGIEPLLAEREVIHLPSASALAVQRQELQGRSPAPKAIALFADPIFQPTDERLLAQNVTPTADPLAQQLALAASTRNAELGSLVRLPATRVEAERITDLVAAGERQRFIGFEASLHNATSTGLADYRILHFATHGLLDSKTPALSGLVLSLFDDSGAVENGFMRLQDIFNLELNADLVVLSACQTGLGKEVRGEGLVGLTRGFMYAGTPRVVVSLWSVADEATAILMAEFYRNLLEENLSPAESLRRAQLKVRQDPRYAAPFFWAAFVLQGDWQ